MKYTPAIFCLVLLSAVLMAFPSHAQMEDKAAVQERMDRLEHDIMLLQRQIARGEAPVSNGAPLTDADVPAGGAAQLEVRLSAIEDEIRQLRGKVEENEFQARKLSENMEKLQRDTEFRFNQLGGKPLAENGVVTSEGGNTPKPLVNETPEQPQGPTTAGDGVLKVPEQHPADDQNFATPRDHYNYAFRLLNQTKYDEAAAAFNSFTKKYPKDPLVGNAYYWEGETFYIRRDFVSAADDFRQGFESLPNGPKAADNLLKLAMSLDALKRDKEACVVLQQITAKFKQTSTSVNEKALQEQKRIGCK